MNLRKPISDGSKTENPPASAPLATFEALERRQHLSASPMLLSQAAPHLSQLNTVSLAITITSQKM